MLSLYNKLDDGKIDRTELHEAMKKVYHINFGESGKVMEVPKKIKDVEAKLGLNLFPT
ncbi:MAG: hypothetical protein ACYDHX_15415 [Methanothrix sp.]